MNTQRERLSLLFLFACVLASCSQSMQPPARPRSPLVQKTTKAPEKSPHKAPHSYGGWYCPDNLRGFPPVNIQNIPGIPVVNGRLPTKAETRNGTSLIYFDTTEVPDARPLDMQMPRIARYFNPHSDKNELIIVIQAVVVNQDTVVGFRYVNGGNGSAWFDEINFLPGAEIAQIGSTPFVHITAEIDASRDAIWKVITNPDNSTKLATAFDGTTRITSDWQRGAKVQHLDERGQSHTTGQVSAAFPPTYLQLDYDLAGKQLVEKFLILHNENGDGSRIHIVSGPHPKDFSLQNAAWNKWYTTVKFLSERKD